ncbi:ATP-binding cassette domain-containing protein [Microbacterium sp. Se63.02b]|uniref:ATP-binding cassette domain-containing protein n=1 Tax=Microbacterium sp. Se63.02b TaxID=2709304 RepID=UPI0031F6176F
MSRPLLDVAGLRISFGRHADRLDVVHGISFSVEAGETVAIVGESGSGKSVTARTLVGLTGPDSGVSANALRFGDHDLRTASKRAWRGIRGGEIGFVLQDALVSLDPSGRSAARSKNRCASTSPGTPRVGGTRCTRCSETSECPSRS